MKKLLGYAFILAVMALAGCSSGGDNQTSANDTNGAAAVGSNPVGTPKGGESGASAPASAAAAPPGVQTGTP